MRPTEYYPDNQLVYDIDGDGTPDCFAPSEPWSDATTPRTERPMCFKWAPSGYRTRRLNFVVVTHRPPCPYCA